MFRTLVSLAFLGLASTSHAQYRPYVDYHPGDHYLPSAHFYFDGGCAQADYFDCPTRACRDCPPGARCGAYAVESLPPQVRCPYEAEPGGVACPYDRVPRTGPLPFGPSGVPQPIVPQDQPRDFRTPGMTQPAPFPPSPGTTPGPSVSPSTEGQFKDDPPALPPGLEVPPNAPVEPEQGGGGTLVQSGPQR